MTASKPKNYAKPIRILRPILGVLLLGNLLIGILDATHGLAIAFLPFVCALFLGCVIAFQTKVIHRIEARNKPRADYALIARMEREVYGEAFEHDGAPQAASGSVAELHAMMDDLAERATAAKRRHASRTKSHAPFEEDRRAMQALATSRRAARIPGMAICPRGHEYFSGGRNHRCFDCEEERHNARYPDTTRPATIDQYVQWLRGYTKRGGKITHTYDYPFGQVGFRYAATSLTIDSDYEYGARARHIIVASGVLAERTNPHEVFSGWGHSHLYFMHGYRQVGDSVPVYSDPEFDEFRRNR